MNPNTRLIWLPFVRTSFVLALTAGFGLGGVLFAVIALGLPLGPWWPAAAQAHGHIQLFGWAGLMVLGVGVHFLPRLRGAPVPSPRRVALALGLLAVGLLLRGIAQPAAALLPPGTIGLLATVSLTLSGLLELAGASLFVVLLAQTLRQGPPLRDRAGLTAVLPLFLTAFVAFWLALALNLAGLATTMASALVPGWTVLSTQHSALSTSHLIPAWADQLTIQLALGAFLIPISIAMSTRMFALYFRTPLPRLGALQVGLALLLAGLALRAFGDLSSLGLAAGLGRLAQAAAFVTFILALGIFAPRRPLPRQPVRPFSDPIQLHAISAYLWLAVAALILVFTGLATLGVAVVPVSLDAERHALGAGFVTMLILGMAVHMLPGFAGVPLRSLKLVWLTLAFGNAAALLRLGPILLPIFSPTLARALLASAGLAGVAAIVVLAFNLLGRSARRLSATARQGSFDVPPP